MRRAANRRAARRLCGLAVAGTLASTVLAGCGDDASETAAETPSTATASATPTDPGSPDPSEAESAAPSESADSSAATTAVPVYFVGDTPRGQRLFREFRAVDASDPLAGAANLLTGGEPLDPDYSTLLPEGELSEVRRAGNGALEVVLPDETWTARPSGSSRRQARLAVQQLVYTLQGTAQTREPLRAYLGESDQPVSLLGVDTTRGVRAADQLDVLGLVNITTPEEGTTVSGSLSATGVASSFEATVPWEVRRGGEVVLDGFATAEGYLDRLYPWSSEIDLSSLAAGSYTLAAMTSDSSGGEGPGPTEDTKTIRIE